MKKLADTERFIPGEIMTAYDSYNPENSKQSEDIVFHNSEDFIILGVTKPKNLKVRVEVYSRAKGSRSFEGEFNVETLTLKNEDVYFNVGGGIVADSDPEAEYEETLLKAKALMESLSGNS